MESLELFYRLTALASEFDGSGARLVWRRSGWLDGTLTLFGDRSVRLMRFGRSVARRVMLYRLGGMMESWRRRGVEYILILVPGYTEMRLVETWLRNSAWGVRAFCAVEADALSATDSDGLMLTRAARRGTYGVSFSRLLESVGERDNEEYRELEAFEARQALRCRRTDGYSAGVRTTGLLRRCRD